MDDESSKMVLPAICDEEIEPIITPHKRKIAETIKFTVDFEKCPFIRIVLVPFHHNKYERMSLNILLFTQFVGTFNCAFKNSGYHLFKIEVIKSGKTRQRCPARTCYLCDKFIGRFVAIFHQMCNTVQR